MSLSFDASKDYVRIQYNLLDQSTEFWYNLGIFEGGNGQDPGNLLTYLGSGEGAKEVLVLYELGADVRDPLAHRCRRNAKRLCLADGSYRLRLHAEFEAYAPSAVTAASFLDMVVSQKQLEAVSVSIEDGDVVELPVSNKLIISYIFNAKLACKEIDLLITAQVVLQSGSTAAILNLDSVHVTCYGQMIDLYLDFGSLFSAENDRLRLNGAEVALITDPTTRAWEERLVASYNFPGLQFNLLVL